MLGNNYFYLEFAACERAETRLREAREEHLGQEARESAGDQEPGGANSSGSSRLAATQPAARAEPGRCCPQQVAGV